MVRVEAYSSSGVKSSQAASLPTSVFGLEVKNQQLLYEALRAHQARGRNAHAKALRRGEVRGGGRKPWRQKGTGRARAGSIRSPLWSGGGVTFGPTGQENYQIKLSQAAKRLAIKQALSLKAQSGVVKVIEDFSSKDGKVKPTVDLLTKIKAGKRVLLVVSLKDSLVDRATRNVVNLKAVQANYLNVFDVLSADAIVISKKALAMVEKWLAAKSAASRAARPKADSLKERPAKGRLVSNGAEVKS